jgi:hypothetical protein
MIDFARIFARAETAGIRHYLVEHDNAASRSTALLQATDFFAG